MIKYDEVLCKMEENINKNKIKKEEDGKWEGFVNYGKVSLTLGAVLGVTIGIPLMIAKGSIISGLKGFFITFVIGALVGAFLSIFFAIKDERGND